MENKPTYGIEVWKEYECDTPEEAARLFRGDICGNITLHVTEMSKPMGDKTASTEITLPPLNVSGA